MATRISATTLDREMSDILNRVAYRGESFLIERGGKEVARLEPVGSRQKVTAADVIARIGHLRMPEGWGDDIEDGLKVVEAQELPEWPD